VIESPSPVIEELGPTTLIGITWPRDELILGSRHIPGQTPVRRELIAIDRTTSEATPIEVPRPPECPSIDAMMPRVVGDRVVFDRRCYPGPATPIAGYHELVELPLDGGEPLPLTRLDWFPDAFVELENGTWLSSYDSGLCAYIDVVPGTGEPPFAWPITVTDDGEPYPVNDGRVKDGCDNAALVSSIAQGPDGALAFLATGASRGGGGFGLLDLPKHLYRGESDGTLRRIGSGLVAAGGLVWRPGTDTLSLYATIEDRSGIWTFEPDGARRLIYEGRLWNFAWSPDGDAMAVIIPGGTEEEPDPPRTLVILTP
jgi:hypothetical protein